MGHQPFPRALPRDNTSGSCGAHGTGRVSASRNPSTPGNRLLPACGDGDATGVEPLATVGRTEDDWLVRLVHCSVAILRLGPRRSFTPHRPSIFACVDGSCTPHYLLRIMLDAHDERGEVRR